MINMKPAGYYQFIRKDIETLLPKKASNVLEIVCGAGATLAWLKKIGKADYVSGIELNSSAAETASQYLDAIYPGDADHHLDQLTADSFDLILCLDVLEHMIDPWRTLGRVHRLLKSNGQLIVSLPNIRHYSVILPLMLRGQFRYTDAGILDRTHLRFFTRGTALCMLEQAQFRNMTIRSNYAWGTSDRYIDMLTLGSLKSFLSFQYLIRADKSEVSDITFIGEPSIV